MTKKIIYIDMDGVLVDLGSEVKKYSETQPRLVAMLGDELDKLPNLFKNPKPITGAINAFNALCNSDLYEVYILSTAPWDNPDAWSHKRLWVEKYLGKGAYKRLILSHNKHLCAGDYLIDDRTANGAGEFKGELIQFGTETFSNWDAILNYLKP
jgi:5'-nucleotidase